MGELRSLQEIEILGEIIQEVHKLKKIENNMRKLDRVEKIKKVDNVKMDKDEKMFKEKGKKMEKVKGNTVKMDNKVEKIKNIDEEEKMNETKTSDNELPVIFEKTPFNLDAPCGNKDPCMDNRWSRLDDLQYEIAPKICLKELDLPNTLEEEDKFGLQTLFSVYTQNICRDSINYRNLENLTGNEKCEDTIFPAERDSSETESESDSSSSESYLSETPEKYSTKVENKSEIARESNRLGLNKSGLSENKEAQGCRGREPAEEWGTAVKRKMTPPTSGINIYRSKNKGKFTFKGRYCTFIVTWEYRRLSECKPDLFSSLL